MSRPASFYDALPVIIAVLSCYALSLVTRNIEVFRSSQKKIIWLTFTCPCHMLTSVGMSFSCEE